MMKTTILMILVLFSGAAAADDIYLTLGGWSKHSDEYYEQCRPKIIGSDRLAIKTKYEDCQDIKYNGEHNSFIVDYKGLTIGTYKNSYGNRTNLAGYTYRKGGFSATAAYGTGYIVEGVRTDCPLKIGKECALLSVGYTYKNVKASLMGTALAVSFEFNL